MKEYLSRKGVQYQERDISRDSSAVEDLRRMGAMATPVVVIDGQVVTGFDQGRIDQLISQGAAA